MHRTLPNVNAFTDIRGRAEKHESKTIDKWKDITIRHSNSKSSTSGLTSRIFIVFLQQSGGTEDAEAYMAIIS